MADFKALLAFVQGAEAYRGRAARRLAGSPFMLRYTYVGGHPGIWESEGFWLGRVGNHLRMVDTVGDRCYDLPLDRIRGVSCSHDGLVHLRFEPTAGLLTTVALRPEEGGHGGSSNSRLLHMVLLGA